MKVGILGSGGVGEILANGFLKHGFEVMRGSREPGKLADWRTKSGPKAFTGTFEETAKFGEMVVLAIKGSAAESAVKLAGVENLRRKIVIDTTNPIADAAPVNGVLQFFTNLNSSLMERLQEIAPDAYFVKAFSCVGSAFMVNPNFPGGVPTMFICGNDLTSKAKVSEVLAKFGWESEDMGSVTSARAIEPLCMLWCIPGFAKNSWAHAFKLLKI